MALFKPITAKARAGQQLQEVYCPRCKILLKGTEHSSTVSGEGVGRRKVEGEYHCTCEYEIKIVETYPVINRAHEN